jgi:hypothetical protein
MVESFVRPVCRVTHCNSLWKSSGFAKVRHPPEGTATRNFFSIMGDARKQGDGKFVCRIYVAYRMEYELLIGCQFLLRLSVHFL